MGLKNTTKYQKIKIGDRYGDWTVIGEVFVSRYAKVPCRCVCGLEKEVDAYTLSIGKSKKCKSCGLPQAASKNPSWNGYKEIPASWFTRFRNYAKKKGNAFSIEMKDVWNVYIKQNKKCALTGLPIDFTRDGKGKQSSYKASIDRINSHKGYTKENIQLVHKDVNIMKNQFDQKHFIEFCSLVAIHNGVQK